MLRCRLRARDALRPGEKRIAEAGAGGLPGGEPETDPATVTYDLSDPDVRHVLTQALEDYADHERAMAERPDASESFARWADLAVQMRDRAQVAGGLA